LGNNLFDELSTTIKLEFEDLGDQEDWKERYANAQRVIKQSMAKVL
jgi:hypothetical protein